MKLCKTIILICLIASAIPFSAFSLEPLTDKEMKNMRAQAGITVALNDNTQYHSLESIRFANPDDPTSFIEFQDVESLINLDCGMDDVNGDGIMGQILIDVHQLVNGEAVVQVSADDIFMDWDVSVGNINVCGVGGDLGSLAVENISIPEFQLYAGPHGCGVDGEFGFQLTVDSMAFQYNETPIDPATGKLVVSGITFAGLFTGTDSDPNLWAAENNFVIGDINADNPATLDVNGDHLLIQSSLKGSLRIENVDFDGTDMGLVLINDINAERLDIEIPGRGLGKP